MKNLKKVLALVLVVATLMGFATVSSAKFSDDSSVTYKEAVEVMSMINVINGYTDGTFRPTANVTRAQMAKMIAYIVAGGEDVGNLYAGANSFTDCASHWAKGYIAYANKTGIVAGVGNGKFNPEGSVTGTQAAKMLLCALGYDATFEGYTGANWAVNVLNRANEIDLLDGLSGVDMSKALSREAAAQMMFNALKATMVKYSQGGVTITDPNTGLIINTGASTAEEVKGTGDDYRKNEEKNETMQLCEKYFSDLKLTKDSPDDFRRPSNVWEYDDDSVTAAKTAKVTYTSETKGKEIYSGLGKTTVNKITSVAAYRNGQPIYTGEGAAAKTLKWFQDNITSSNSSYVTENGMSVEIFIDGKAATIVVVDTALVQVSKINSKDKDNLKANFTGKVSFNELNEEDSKLDLSELEEDDYVLVTATKDAEGKYNVKSIEIPEAVEGEMSARKTTDTGAYVTVGGTKYAINAANFYDVDDMLKTSNYDNTYTLYVGADGQAYGAVLKDEASTSNEYLYVTDREASAKGIGGDAYVKVAATFTDGTSKVVNLYVKNAGKTDASVTIGTSMDLSNGADAENVEKALADGWYSYSTNSSGEYKLTPVTAASPVTGSGASEVKNAAFVGTGDKLSYGSNSAKIYYNYTDVSNKGASVNATSSTKLDLVDSGKSYTGYKNFIDVDDIKMPTDASKVSVLYVLSSKGSQTVKAIYVIGEEGTTSKTTIAYLGDMIGSTADGDQYEFFVDGKSEKYFIDSSINIPDGKKIFSIEVDEDDTVTKLAEIATVDFSAADSGKYSLIENVEITKVEGADYFEAKKGETPYTFYFENSDEDIKCGVFDADDGLEASLSKYADVTVVYAVIDGENFAVAAYVN